MRTFEFRLKGRHERVMLEVEARSVADLAQELSCKRFLTGRMVSADGEITSREMSVAV